jgi:hypothetical protein
MIDIMIDINDLDLIVIIIDSDDWLDCYCFSFLDEPVYDVEGHLKI